ncbi:amidohydrolase family protein [Agrobacterium sp. SOY23]|uniref:N-acetylglucosamine-6-phosphate deacetylase n=1 Tax=Agrobacterium sp. SOY23 TaxID=3014555 RepID=UPI0022AE972E|nr:amidohydrolase family protein [Agrobacterium sp. SOY23]MCZ4431132.1 amidohydrolase family protein [Agrobacterium sp. SOY23]
MIVGRDAISGKVIGIAVENGWIAALRPIEEDLGEDLPWLAPGLIDLQVNGWGGHDFNRHDINEETVLAVAAAMRSQGIRAFLPTLITASSDAICNALSAIATARTNHQWLTEMIPGVHVEGPFISPEDGARGAHPREHVRSPCCEEFDQWQKASGGIVRLVTLCPKQADARAFIRHVRNAGCLVSIGHSSAEAADIAEASQAGAGFSTHLGNGVSQTLPRHPNLIWAQLANDGLQAMFIADGHHLDRVTLTAMLRAKGVQRSILVSDMVALAGMPPGRYRQPVGGDVELSAEGRLSMAGTRLLAGAAKPLSDGVALVAGLEGFNIRDAITMAAVNPAKALGLETGLREGARADFIAFRWVPGETSLRLCEPESGAEPSASQQA